MSESIRIGSNWKTRDGDMTCTVVFRFEDIVRLDFGGWADNYSVAELLREFVPDGAAPMDLNRKGLN